MIVYMIVMLLTSALFAVLAAQIYQGKTKLIHDYHQKNVTDKAAYGKAFGKALGLMAATMAVSGILAFVMPLAVVVLLTGFAVSILRILRVQKKYNGGLF